MHAVGSRKTVDAHLRRCPTSSSATDVDANATPSGRNHQLPGVSPINPRDKQPHQNTSDSGLARAPPSQSTPTAVNNSCPIGSAMRRLHVAAFLLLALLVVVSARKHRNTGNATDATGGPAAAPSVPACCNLLKPMLPFLKADSLEQLQLPVLIFTRNNNGTLQPTKNRIHGSLCICGSPNGTNHDWMKTKMGVRGSTSVHDFTRKSYGVTTKGKSKVSFLGEVLPQLWCP